MGITIFIPAPMPKNEALRDREIKKTGVLKLRNIEFLESQCGSIRRYLGMDWCGFGIVHEDMNNVIASSGGKVGIYHRRTAFSSYVIFDPSKVFYVLDAQNDERFAGNPFVDDGLIMFYAGVAVNSSDGLALGVLSVTSKTPRSSFGINEREYLGRCAKHMSSTLNTALANAGSIQLP